MATNDGLGRAKSSITAINSEITKYKSLLDSQTTNVTTKERALWSLQSSGTASEEDIQAAKDALDAAKAQKEATQNLYTDAQARLASAQANLEAIAPGSTSSAIDTGLYTAGDSNKPQTYEYNPPLAKDSYFSATGLQLPLVNQYNAKTSFIVDDSDAKTYWTGKKLGKGTIQQSRKFPYKFDADINNPKVTTGEKKVGFRFLYNPTEVFMNWGTASEIDVGAFMSGKLLANPITDAASASSINFSLVLNRIADMTLVDANGKVSEKAYLSSGGTISATHAKGIYSKGTMYDLEYLFKAVNGFGSGYVNSLGIETSDPGWMNSFPVELHLGTSLRYLVRITNLEVNHKIFDPRMVPVFSVVNIVCKRLPDYEKATGTTSGGFTAVPNQGGFR